MSQPVQQFLSGQILISLEARYWDKIFEVRSDILFLRVSLSVSVCLSESETFLILLQILNLSLRRREYLGRNLGGQEPPLSGFGFQNPPRGYK